MTKYQVIFNICVWHEYFRNQQPRNIQLLPDPATAQWMKHQGMIFVQKGNTGSCLVSQQLGLTEIVDKNPGFRLCFSCFFSDPEFVNYTDLPFGEMGKLAFSNEMAGPGGNDPIELKGTFQAETAPTREAAFIEIYLENVANDPAAWPLSYSVRFSARATRWKYYIINQTDEKYKRLQLQGEHQALFSGPTSVRLSDETEASLFDSGSNLLPIKEDNNIDLSLLGTMGDSSDSTATTLIEHLPNAVPSSLQVSETAGQKEIYSAIFIYL